MLELSLLSTSVDAVKAFRAVNFFCIQVDTVFVYTTMLCELQFLYIVILTERSQELLKENNMYIIAIF